MKNMKGFTLIEITLTLVIIGILAAVAAPKYFDMQEAAEKQAAKATVAEAQARVNATFGEALLSGSTCSDAVASAKNALSSNFGDYTLIVKSWDETGKGMPDIKKGSDAIPNTDAYLQLPLCDSPSSTFASANIKDSVSTLISSYRTTPISQGNYYGFDSNIKVNGSAEFIGSLNEILKNAGFENVGYLRAETDFITNGVTYNNRPMLVTADGVTTINNSPSTVLFSDSAVTKADLGKTKTFISYDLTTGEYSLVKREIKTNTSTSSYYVKDEGFTKDEYATMNASKKSISSTEALNIFNNGLDNYQ